jgi:hypothetical protein
MSYGKLPQIVVPQIECELQEVAYLLYLPMSVPGDPHYSVPYPYMSPVCALLNEVRANEFARFTDEYVYLTLKKMIVGPSVTPNRPGWHADGFGSDDLNYVWYDSVPTIFNKSRFVISDDHVKSLEEFDQQALPENDVTFPCKSLLKLDPYVVHRVQMADREQMRTFVKISISKNPYNLKGNSINPYLPKFKMFDRAAVRNDPTKAQQDFHPVNDDHFA